MPISFVDSMRHRGRTAVVLAGLLLVVGNVHNGVGQNASSLPGRETGVGLIREGDLKSYVQFLASDELAGRATPSAGLEIAARFIETRLRGWGVLGAAADGGYRERIPLARVRVDSTRTSIRIGSSHRALGEGFDAMLYPGEAEGELVFVGHGWRDPDNGIDPFKGLDLSGKVVVAVEGHPAGFDVRKWLRRRQASALPDPYAYAQQAGASAFVMIPRFEGNSYWKRFGEIGSETGVTQLADDYDPKQPGSKSFPYDGPGGSLVLVPIPEGGRIPAIVATKELTRTLLAGAESVLLRVLGETAGTVDTSFALDSGQRLRITTAVHTDTLWIENIVAMIPGSDSSMAAQNVVIGAHYDHLGAQKPGADDNASGSSALLAIAGAMAAEQPAPPRTVVFSWFAGEERGLWGSRWAVRHSNVDPKSMVEFINLDMIGRSGGPRGSSPRNEWTTEGNEVLIVGVDSTDCELNALLDRTNRDFMALDYTFVDEESVWWGTDSDHGPFAEAGVPHVWFFTGFHDDYHGVGDTWDKIDYAKLEAIARTVFLTARAIAGTTYAVETP